MVFQFKVKYEKSDYLAFCKLHDRTQNQKRYILRLVFAVLNCILELYLLCEAIRTDWFDTVTITLLILFPVLSLELLLFPQIQAVFLSKTHKNDGINQIAFDENEVTQAGQVSRAQYDYSAFEQLYHYRGGYYLYINRQTALLIPERCYTQGDPAAFGSFISEKTGLQVEEVK